MLHPLSAVYLFKKAMILLQTLSARFPPSPTQTFPIPQHPGLPIFSDNVIPTLLLTLGLFRLPPSHPLTSKFPSVPCTDLLTPTPTPTEGEKSNSPLGGPVLDFEEMTILRAAAVHAVQRTVEFVRGGGMDEEEGCDWMEEEMDEAGLDAVVWMGGKERADWRKVERFVGDSIYF